MISIFFIALFLALVIKKPVSEFLPSGFRVSVAKTSQAYFAREIRSEKLL
jgi:hypothetical protein